MLRFILLFICAMVLYTAGSLFIQFALTPVVWSVTGWVLLVLAIVFLYFFKFGARLLRDK